MKQINLFLFSLLTLTTLTLNAQNFQWARGFGGTNDDIGRSITIDASGNVYTTGYFAGTVDFDPRVGVTNLTSNSGSNDVFVQKMDAAGNFVWAKRFGGTNDERGYSITTDASGNVYTTGYFFGTVDFDPSAATTIFTSTGSTDIFVQKMDASGTFIWARTFGGTNADVGYAIRVDASGNIYTTGSFVGTADFDPSAGTINFTSAGGNDVFIQRMDAAGNFLWAIAFGGILADVGQSITIDASGNVYIAGLFNNTVDFDPGVGTTNLTSAGLADVFVQKIDATGSFVWAKAFGGTNADIGNSITTDASGNVYTIGYFAGTADFDPSAGTTNLTSAGGNDIFVQKMDASGSFMWAKTFGGTAGDLGYSITTDASSNVYTTGYFTGTADFDPSAGTTNLTSTGSTEIFVQKMDVSGNFIWAVAFGGTSADAGNAITTDASGNVYTTGYFAGTGDFDPSAGTTNLTSAGNNDIFVQKLNQSVLPLQMLNFQAMPQENTVNLTWQTAQETNNTYFTVEKSQTGDHWVGVNTLNGGNTTYQTTDLNPFYGTSYYRLKQTNADGNSQYSEIKTVIINPKNGVVIFPNPTYNQITLQATAQELNTIQFYNNLGQDVTHNVKQVSTSNNEVILDLNNLPKGIYVVRTATTTSKVYKQ